MLKENKKLTPIFDLPADATLPLDLAFITNKEGETLKERFIQLIKDSSFFDCLVAYFYVSGFHLIYKALQNTEKIRILIGIATNKETYNLIRNAEDDSLYSSIFSHAETKQRIENILENEISDSEDGPEIEKGIQEFIKWIREKKLEIRVYPSQKIHAKLYIITFKKGDRDKGRVITGSSNFTQSGLIDNLEFNVELKNSSDYNFAKQKFGELWKDAVNVSDKYIQIIENKTYLNQNITPYQLYLKFLYEYFKEDLSSTDELFTKFLPQDFKELEYQKQAVLNAKKILEKYGGVFISDVVGLGKTYISAMLAEQIDGRTLVLAPPALLNTNNPGSWPNVFEDFGVRQTRFESHGKLDDLIREGTDKYKNIIIDESHRFRNETTISYEKIAEICRGKRVILVSATPYNNSPMDILAQIKLFHNTRKSHIPGVANLEEFFEGLARELKNINRKENYEEFLNTTQKNAKEIRNRVLKYLMVRRTREEIEKYFADDLRKNNVKFPEVEDPKPFFYQLNDEEDRTFMETVRLITKEFIYARYMPLVYLKKGITQLEDQSQRNMGSFMKVLLVKRLESSFFAFRNSINRFIYSYDRFIEEYKNGNVYISKGYINKIFQLLDQGDDDAIQKLIDEGRTVRYKKEDFKQNFLPDLENDLKILQEIKDMWQPIKRDPKLETLLKNLKTHEILKNKKIIMFTESKETAEYLKDNINREFGEIALLFHGSSPEAIRDKVIDNFDARAKNKKDDYRILVSTEVLSEGVNLHRANIIINYDIPWNPTRLMQRVGRINRVDTPFDRIYTFNFFPTEQSDNEINLTTIARSKIEAFLTLLGGDSSILTEGEPVSSHELFDKLLSKKTILQEEDGESELKYLRIIEDIRNKEPDLFEKIKLLPKKARSAKEFSEQLKDIVSPDSLITFFRQDKLTKFFLSDKNNNTKELDFLTSAKILESKPDEKRTELPLDDYYQLLKNNKNVFYNPTTGELTKISSRKGTKDTARQFLQILKIIQKYNKQFTEEQEEYLRRIISCLEEGLLPKKTVQRAFREVKKLGKDIISTPLQVISILQKSISPVFLSSHYAEVFSVTEGKGEVILSLYLTPMPLQNPQTKKEENQ